MSNVPLYQQTYKPNVHIAAKRGWCLKYVDDAGNAPTRRPNAKAAYDAEKKAKRIRTSTPPQNVWVVGFLSFGAGQYQAYGHVFFMKYKGNGKYEIRDSETNAGARSIYPSINAILAWFGNYKPRYIGWSTHCDGREYAKEVPAAPKRIARSGKAKVIVDVLNVRDGYSTKHKVVATYKKGQTFNYDSYIVANGYTWLSYVSWSGKRRYVAQGTGKTKYVTGGV